MFFTPFIFGTLAASFALILEIVVLDFSHVHDTSSLVLAASSLATLGAVALIEEGAKYLFLRQYLLRSFSSVELSTQALLRIGLALGAGFAAVETAFILMDGIGMDDSLWLLGILLVHGVTSLMLAFFLRSPVLRLFSAAGTPLFLAIFIHFLYDASLAFLL